MSSIFYRLVPIDSPFLVSGLHIHKYYCVPDYKIGVEYTYTPCTFIIRTHDARTHDTRVQTFARPLQKIAEDMQTIASAAKQNAAAKQLLIEYIHISRTLISIAARERETLRCKCNAIFFLHTIEAAACNIVKR